MKDLLVMKFGGTSVSDPDRIRRAARRVAEARADGHRVAVVVTAPLTADEAWVDLPPSALAVFVEGQRHAF